MNKDEQARIFQTNVAHEQRNVAGNYWEVHAQSNMKFAMATWPAKRLDKTAIENPRFFKARFGFDASTIARIKVIAFQRKFDLLDSDITLLKRGSLLKVDRQGVRIDESYLIPLVGWLQIGALGIAMTILFNMNGFSAAPDWRQTISCLFLGLVSASTLIWIIRSCFLPLRLLRECGALDEVDGKYTTPAAPRKA